MKRFGLRALASTLATLMVVSAFGPAKAASAADDILLIAPNPNALKTLYITEDMVDEDGEIVISGGSYDRVVVSKEVAAKDIYFDQVTVGEMVVESGGDSRIQLWEVDAEQVIVQEPELEALKLSDLKDLLADQETRAAALQMYIESLAKDEKTKKTAPTIVTKEDAAVDSFVARANATLDLAEGEVDIVALEGSEKVDRAKVTLKNYKGDVSFKGSEGKSNMTLNNVDSRINTLKVEESDADDYFMVNAKNSVVIKAEVGGNANLSLNALTGALEVTEEATAANVTLLNTIEEMNIAGNGATVEVAPCARVEMMAVAGNDAKVTGSGTLVEADITGKGAYVSTYGSKVKGENTYVPPVYVAPEKSAPSFAELPEGSLVLLPKDLSMGGYGHTKNVLEDGSVEVAFNGQYQEIQFYLDDVDLSIYDKMIVSLDTKGTDTANHVVFKICDPNAEKDKYNNPVPFIEISNISKHPGGDYEIDLSGHADKKVNRFTLMANNAACNTTVYRIAFLVKDGATPPAEDNTPKEPVIPEGAYTFDKVVEASGGWNVSMSLNANKGADLNYTGNWSQAFFKIPDEVDITKLQSITLNGVKGNNLQIRLLNAENFATYTSGDDSVAIQGETGSVTMSTGGNTDIKYFIIVSTIAQKVTVDSVSFTLAGESTDNTPTPPTEEDPVIPAAPSTLPDTYHLVRTGHYFHSDGNKIGGYGYEVERLDYHYALKVKLEKQNQEIQLKLSEPPLNVADYEKMIVTVSSTTDNLAVKVYDSELNAEGKLVQRGVWYNQNATTTTDLEFDLTKLDSQEGSIGTIGIMANNAACEFIFYRVAFVPKGASGGTAGGGEATSKPEPVVDLTPDADVVTLTTNEDGSITAVCAGQYKGVTYNVPSTATKVNEVTTVIVNITADSQFGLQAYSSTGTKIVEQYPGSNLKSETTQDYFITIDPTTNVLGSIRVQSQKADQTFTVNSITFVAEEMITLDSIYFYVGEGESSVVTATTNQDGSVTLACTDQYKGASCSIPSSVIGDAKIVSVTANVTADAQFGMQAQDANWQAVASDYPGYGLATETTANYSVAINPDANGITAVRIQSQKTEQTVTINSITVGKLLWSEKNW